MDNTQAGIHNRRAYIKEQIIANLVINGVINGLIAYFSYRSRSVIPLIEIAIDIQISIAIIGFLVSWIGILAARNKIKKGDLSQSGSRSTGLLSIWLPKNVVLRSLTITTALMLVFGGLGLTGLIALLSPNGFSNWGYIVFKTLYTGGCAALASILAVTSVFQENFS